jgi:hypothetical protein
MVRDDSAPSGASTALADATSDSLLTLLARVARLLRERGEVHARAEALAMSNLRVAKRQCRRGRPSRSPPYQTS